jgi:hypothetical protein
MRIPPIVIEALACRGSADRELCESRGTDVVSATHS